VSARGRRCFVALGSNLGDRERYLRAGRDDLETLPTTSLIAASRVYETAPQGYVDQDAFLNQVVCLETALAPLALLHECQRIEDAHGRVREVRFGPRTLDIDILLVEDVVSDDLELTLPHPRMIDRAFVLVPLAEIWDHARGMPEIDVEGLGKAAAASQAVRLFGPEGDE
jgi:2-amino-4-hydroxy-6-hydroxymethyldihydropteridine diphosphokinase